MVKAAEACVLAGGNIREASVPREDHQAPVGVPSGRPIGMVPLGAHPVPLPLRWEGGVQELSSSTGWRPSDTHTGLYRLRRGFLNYAEKTDNLYVQYSVDSFPCFVFLFKHTHIPVNVQLSANIVAFTVMQLIILLS